MINTNLKVAKPTECTAEEREIFKALLENQGKVQNISTEKIDRCQYLCFCFADNIIVSIGALKPKTVSDFNENKADLPKLESQFEWEIGYFYTEENYRGKGYATEVINGLISHAGEINLMASTELREDNKMKKILEQSGFKKFGKNWQSLIHGGDLGLFLKFGKKE